MTESIILIMAIKQYLSDKQELLRKYLKDKNYFGYFPSFFSKERLLPILKSPLFRGASAVILLVLVLDLLFPPPSLKPYSKTVLSNDGTLLTAYLSDDDKWRMKTNLKEVSPDLINAIVNKEDKWFYWHPGVNFAAVIRAMFSNITKGETVSGASTITMQVIRMLEPAERTYFNKFVEMLRALQLELHYSKDEILEMYFSLLPYGGNIEGVKSASYIFFNRHPAKLSLAQSILLTIIPNNPNHLRLDKTKNVASERNRWAKKFIAMDVFPKQDLLDAIDEPVEVNRYAVPRLAPHFCLTIKDRFNDDAVFTSLDLVIQTKAENLLKNYVNRVRGKGVSNGAVLVIENKTNKVRAYCGSYDFDDSFSSGQVDGIASIRSPGSTLKPFLYALAFDMGILTPKMKLYDIPTDFSGYEPENYDLQYYGDVTAEFALVNSLNIPAVQLLQETGYGHFLALLERGGLNELRYQKERLGLSLVLGGCGIKMENLVRLYTSLANDGYLFPLSYLADTLSEVKKSKLFSSAAVYLTADILSKNERPDFPALLLQSANIPQIAWKTGTSFGKRDAWAIGYNPRYTIAVWMGNFDGAGSPHLSGAEMSVPLLFDLFNGIDVSSKKEWFQAPEEIDQRKVCSLTGFVASHDCKSVTYDYAIEDVSPQFRCELMKDVYVNQKETLSYCTDCLPNFGYKKVKYPFYPAELALWYINNKIYFPKVPPHNKECQSRFNDSGPKILSPSPAYEYYLERGANQKLLLSAAVNPSVTIYYWYVNGKFFKKSFPGERLFIKPVEGTNEIICLDDKGRRSKVTVNVKYY